MITRLSAVRTFLELQEPVCSLIGLVDSNSACRSYNMLSMAAQRAVRVWTMTAREKRSRFANRPYDVYSDIIRHAQLLHSNSRFCCRTIHKSSSSSLHSTTQLWPIINLVFIPFVRLYLL
ncbi:hypothetical protein AB6A40_005765 [Gnathostoma spinigerum]|uniref:Uncharacterized protein n=1 Tax=Gnathostoma spinigerum TaxID=75299 RepID=A0ABD6EH58_9BILA